MNDVASQIARDCVPRDRVLIEDALKHVHDCEYNQQTPTAQSLAGALAIDLDRAARVLAQLASSGLIVLEEGQHRLTGVGRDYARHVIRAHRLYETYLAEQTGVSAELWHRHAEQMEHALTDEKIARMARELGEPRFDPHGDPIPTAQGELPPQRGIPLLECPPGWVGQIIHVEDEPPSGYAQVVAVGLAAGMRIRVLETNNTGVRLNAEGLDAPLSRVAAGHLLVAALPPTEHFDTSVTRLSTLRKGERAAIVGLSALVRGPERNRLLDLGFVPGSTVEIDLVSPSGNPVGYLVRGATIALRREQSERILIKKAEAN